MRFLLVPERLMPQAKWQLSKHTGALYEYCYRHITALDEDSISQYCASLRHRFRALKPQPEAAEQWIARTYISLKYVLAASVMLSSAEFASARNLRIVEPYLLYYSIFNASRALCLLIPELQWNDGSLLDALTHTKVQNVVHDCLRYFSQSTAGEYKVLSSRALAAREMLSYKFPALGLSGRLGTIMPRLEDVVGICEFVADAAQLHSECVEAEFRDLPDVEFPDDSKPLEKLFIYQHKSLDARLIDSEDAYRMWQFVRHSTKPWSLHQTAREGLVEDFFGAWASEEGKQGQYDADKTDWSIIFDFF